ncbi:MAG: peptidoglycan bridge formation glycyltransferase FemA/FemB family protein [Candidatus Pacebacteria bacterium]|nr:peptidoglycan bridge formation glycyltransferase FemA/FemB family protein [Candidatus Paceibacterota bacterium]
MEVREINSKEELEEFLSRVKPATFLISWNWGEFEKRMGNSLWRLGVYDSEKLIAVASITKVVARRGTFFAWHHSPVIDPVYSGKISEILKALKDTSVAIGKKENCHFIRVSSILSDSPAHSKIFTELGFRNAPIHLHSEHTSVLSLLKSEDELQSGMRKNTRYAIRKAAKDGVLIESSKSIIDFEKFWSIYMDTVKRQNFTPFSRKYLENEFKTFLENGQALLWFGKYKGEYISTAFIVYTSNSGFYHHGASNHLFPSVSASELLQWEAIKEAKKRGCESYNFWGIVAEDDKKHPWYGLSQFKRGFGGVEEKYVSAQDYVLSPKYWINFIIETVRKMKRGI